MKTKKRVVGTESYINSSTGELIQMEIVETDTYEKDSNFHKLFLHDFITTMNLVANQKTKLCYWILDNLTKDNVLLYTYRQISEKTGISYATVADTMKTLQQADFLRKQNSGYYIVNPNIIFKGTYQKRCIALNHFTHTVPEENLTLAEVQLIEIEKNISRLERQKKRLQKNIDCANSD